MKRKSSVLWMLAFLAILFIGCNKRITIEDALEKANIKTDKIYTVDESENIAVAFYKDNHSKNQMVGLFYKEKDGLHFVVQEDLFLLSEGKEDVTFNAIFQDQTDRIPTYSFQYGIINNPKIEAVNLHMTDGFLEDRNARIIEFDGLRIWYELLDMKRIFNVQQGISKDGKIIYSSSEYYR